MSRPADTVERVRSLVLSLPDTVLEDAGAESRYLDLRGELDAVPAESRARPWRQASVLLDVRFRRRPARVLRVLRRMRSAMAHDGQDAQFARFHAEVERLLGDHTVSLHGYAPRLDAVDVPDLWRRVSEVGARLEGLGLSWFATSGTLLGLVREGSLLPYDDDVDLVVLLDAVDEDSAARAWRRCRDDLVDLIRPQQLHRVAKVDQPGAPTIDLFPGWVAGDRVFVWPWSHGDVPRAAVLPLARLDVGGVAVPMPRDPETLLAVNYGPSWREPDPLFAFDWERALERFARFAEQVELP